MNFNFFIKLTDTGRAKKKNLEVQGHVLVMRAPPMGKAATKEILAQRSSNLLQNDKIAPSPLNLYCEHA